MSPRHLLALLIALTSLMPAEVHAQLGILRRAIDDDDDSPRLPGTQGNVIPEHEKKKTEADGAYRAGDFPKVIELTSAVLRENPSDSVAYYLRGSARVELGARNGDLKSIRDGIADSREAIRFDTKKTSMYYLPYLHGMKSLAVIENRREHAETAVTVATQALTAQNLTSQDRANLLFQRSQSQAFLAKSNEAIADCEEAIKLVPLHFGARAAVADLYVAANKPEQAAAAFNKLVESFPDSPLSYNNRGMFQQQQNKFDEAITDFTRAIERDPKYYYAYTNRGFTLLRKDDPAGAEADFVQSLKLMPQQPFLYNLIGLTKLSRNDVAGAIAEQRKAVQLAPNDPIAKGDLGFLLYFADDFAGAVREFDAALALNAQFRHLQPWRIAALSRSGSSADLKPQFASDLAKPAAQRAWIDHLVAYLLGTESEAELLAAAAREKDPVKTDQTCEANYFIAQSKLAKNDVAGATAALQAAVATKSKHLSAFRGAQFALSKTATVAK